MASQLTLSWLGFMGLVKQINQSVDCREAYYGVVYIALRLVFDPRLQAAKRIQASVYVASEFRKQYTHGWCRGLGHRSFS